MTEEVKVEMKVKIRYDAKLLEKLKDELGFETIGEYEKLNRNTKIIGKCRSCDKGTFEKTFRSLYTRKLPICTQCYNGIKTKYIQNDLEPDIEIEECVYCEKDYESYPNYLQNNLCLECNFPSVCKSKSRLCKDDNCLNCYKRSFAACWESKLWDFEENIKKPRDIRKGINDKFIFKCNVCFHIFEKSLSSLTSKNNRRGCPYCTHQKLCGYKSCNFCFYNSFASSEKSKFWSKKNKKKPQEVFLYSHGKFWFDCFVCNHCFDSTPSDITSGKNWCPYCSNQRRCQDQNCNFCFNHSFASNSLSKFWIEEKNGPIRNAPRSGNTRKYWFNCDKCPNIFEYFLSDICRGRWCPLCRHKTEEKLRKFLKEFYPSVQFQKSFIWCKTKNGKMKFDFYIDNLQVIIELDGRQHFEQVANWEAPETIFTRDIFKMKKALENNLVIIRLLQEDVFHDKNSWKEKLQEALEKCPFEKPKCIFLSEDKCYDKYREAL